MTTYSLYLTHPPRASLALRLRILIAFVAAVWVTNVFAEAPAAQGGVAATLSAAELDKLVGPIALYPDDLVAIILPASTNPLQIVQADRFLDKRKTDPKLAVDEKWDDAVKALLNYPDVVKTMSNDLDWTTALGEAVVIDQGAVLEAIQVFRRKALAAGNLKSDTKQVIIVEKEVVKIVPADPQVIYVPQYNPSTVVVYSTYPTWSYYPAPYPVYYYPYPPGAAFAAGLVWGAAISAVWHDNHYVVHYGGYGGTSNININNVNINNVNINNVNKTGTPSQLPAGTTTQWKPNKQPGQVSSSSSARVGHTAPGGGSKSAATGQPSAQPTATSTKSGGSAFGDYSSGRQTQMDSSRGAASRSSMSGAGAGQMSRGGSLGGRRTGRR